LWHLDLKVVLFFLLLCHRHHHLLLLGRGAQGVELG
jgi:hypothetical protein